MKQKEKCVICHSHKTVFLDGFFDGKILYKLYLCNSCGVNFWTPFINPGSDWYENDERYKNANNNPSVKPTKAHKKVIYFIAPFRGKVLDIGCGTGNFLYYAKKRGWEVFGIDFDSNAVNAAKNILLLPNIELKTLNEYINEKDKNLKFNLITFFDVFEHIDNHLEFIEQVKSILVENGYVAMSMPYGPGSRWLQPHDLPPRHLTRWNEKSIKFFLQNNNFDILYLKRNPASFYNIVMKLRFKYGKFLSFGCVKKIKSKIIIDKNFKVETISILAILKDLVLFGFPALFIWIYFWITGGIYVGLFVIARKK